MKHQLERRPARNFKSRGLRHSLRAGFTLIEILVVIAIIAILASILFPVFKTARAAAHSASCQSNLKQLGLAFMQYSQDNGGRLPGGGNYQDWDKPGHWVRGTKDQYLAKLGVADKADEYPYISPRTADVEGGALFPYAKSGAVYVCPSNEDGEAKHLTYGMNCAISGGPVSRVRFPNSMVLLVDEWRASDAFFWAINDPASTDTVTKDHNASGNLLFLDGHVKSYTNDSLPLDETPTGLANKMAGNTRATEPKSTDTPRFRDVTLGPDGAYYPSPFYSNYSDPAKPVLYDACAVKR